MTESTFTQYIMKKLNPKVYRWKILNMMQNGVPDAYFSGPKGDLWVEFKYIKAPKLNTTVAIPKLTKLQKKWLYDRWYEGRNVAVILGSELGSHIYNDNDWNLGVQRQYLSKTPKQVIEWIELQTLDQ